MLDTIPAAGSAAPPPVSPLATPRAATPKTVRVPLLGKHGAGHSMLLDADEWERVRSTWGGRWRLHPNGNGNAYVTFSGVVRAPHVHKKTARLARLLVGARPGDLVIHRDRDQLNLTRANLLHLDKEAAREWLREHSVSSSGAARHLRGLGSCGRAISPEELDAAERRYA